MEPNQNIIELKFEGNGVRPSAVKASEIAELLSSFEGAIVAVIRQQHASVDDAEVFVSFEQIRHESISLKCLAHKAREFVIPALMTIAQAVSTNAYTDLPSGVIEDLRKITRFARRHECQGVWINNGERLAEFDQETEIVVAEEAYVRGDTTIYGEVLKAGGDNPRVTLKIDDEYTVSFEVRRDIAIKLAGHLYKEVGLAGNARWNKQTYKVVDFRAESVIFLEQAPLTDTFDRLGRLFGNSLNSVNSEGFFSDSAV